FKADGLLSELRADKVGDEFGIQYVILGNGMEYQKLNEIKATGATYIIPLKFPEPFDMENPYLSSFASLEDLKNWNQAPTNLKVLAENKVPFILTTHDSDDKWKANLLQAVEYGLDKKAALAALTTVPAKLIGQEGKLGTLKEGAWANFIITSGDFFDKETVLYENWVQGNRNIVEDMNIIDLAGTYNITVDGRTYELTVSGEAAKPKTEVKLGETKIGSKATYADNWLS